MDTSSLYHPVDEKIPSETSKINVRKVQNINSTSRKHSTEKHGSFTPIITESEDSNLSSQKLRSPDWVVKRMQRMGMAIRKMDSRS